MDNRLIITFLLFFSLLAATSCTDHDDPELSPIDTSEVKITAQVNVDPSAEWLNPTEQITVTVSDVNMSAPKGVVLRNISIMVNGQEHQQKPFSGEPLEFKLPLTYFPKGRVNIAVWGELIKKNSRDADIIIADNIERVLFSETPEFDCEATVDITVSGKSTSGEEYNRSFQVKSADRFTIPVPASELYWTPASGTASSLNVTLTASAKAFSTNSTLESVVSRLYWGGSGEERTISFTLPNTAGSLDAKHLQLMVQTVRFGTWENVTVGERPLIYSFGLVESR